MSQAYALRSKRGLMGVVAVLGLIVGLCLLLIPGATDAAKGQNDSASTAAKGKKKKKSKPPKVMTQNLYLGSDLTPIIAAANEGQTPSGNPLADAAAKLAAGDHFINEVGFTLKDIEANNFAVRAQTIAGKIKKKRPDVVGLQEVALFKLSVPPVLGSPATTPLIDYSDTLLEAINAKARTKKQCKKKGISPKSTKCFRGYRLVALQQEADVEQPGDFDNDPGPNLIGGNGPAFTTAGPAAGTPPCGNATFSTQETNPGGDDTGVEAQDPGPPNTTVLDPAGGFNGQPVPFDWNGDSNTNSRHSGPGDGSLNCGPDTLAPHVFGGTAPPYQYASDCPDNNPLDGESEGPADKTDTTSSCVFHGIDGEVRLQMRDAIIVRKGAGVKTRNPQGGNYNAALTLPILGGAASVRFTRGWTAAGVTVRGRSFHVVNTHLESESIGTVREDQAAELVDRGAVGSVKKTVLLGDLNSDPSIAPGSNPNTDSSSNIAYNRIAAAGYFPASLAANTSGHAEILNNPNDNSFNKRIDWILSNDPRITMRSSSLFNVFVNGLWQSDHAGVISTLNVPKKKGGKKKK